MRVAVVGGGVAGLTAAYDLAGSGVDVTLYDAGDRPGGKVRTEPFAGTVIDTAPDAFLARRPEALQLCEELGLTPELAAPARGNSYVWSRGRLRPVPRGQVLGVPTDFAALRASGIVSRRGARRAALEPWLPGRPLDGDVAVGAWVRRRYGAEVAERLVDPLVGGINAGHTDALSIEAVAPQLAAVARSHRSMTRALRALPPPAPGPVFYTVQGGMERLARALAAAVVERGGHIESGAEVASLADLGADAVVLAVPAYAASRLLEPVAPAVAGELASISYSSVTLVTFAYPDEAVERPLDASGFLVPRPERLLMTACSWASSKWAHLAAPGRFLLRVSAGRVGDDRAEGLTDGEVVRRLRDELALTMGVSGEPHEVAVHRWHRAFPQYAPGHLDRVRALQEVLPAHVALAGAALGGVGIPACIGTGRAAAARARRQGAGGSR